MTTNAASDNAPLWLSMEEMILALPDGDFAAASKEATIQRLARDLDEAGYNVSRHAGNMIQLRAVVDERAAAGGPLLEDFNSALSAFQLEDVANPDAAVAKLVREVGENFPLLKSLERRADVVRIVDQTRLDLLVARAKELGGEKGIRFLITSEVEADVLTESLGITREEYEQVVDKMAAEQAERKRVLGLLEEVTDAAEDARIKHLIGKDVAEELIVEIAEVDQAAVDAVKQAMEEELAEKRRLEEEAAAKRKAEAAGPALDDIAPDDMLDYIESIREILEFSDAEKEIRFMCEQSKIPNALVDIAISEPDKLDELEAQAEG
jgi:hypothetical protein